MVTNNISIHSNYRRPVSFIIGRDLYYYDIERAGIRLLQLWSKDKGYNELYNELVLLERHDSDTRNIRLGLLVKRYGLTTILERLLVAARQRFVRLNNIPEHRVLAIKRDAFVLIDHPCRYTVVTNRFGIVIQFRLKHIYHSYCLLNNIEFYQSFGRDYKPYLTISGISDSIIESHRAYLIELLNQVLYQFFRDTSRAAKYLLRLLERYLNYQLEPEYYREFNQYNAYRLNSGLDGYIVYTDNCPADMEQIDIIYNYQRYLLPLLQLIRLNKT